MTTLTEAAAFHAATFDLDGEEKKQAINDFKAGAEWQKEQDKELAEAAKELYECDYTSGTHLSTAQHMLWQVLQKYFDIKS